VNDSRQPFASNAAKLTVMLPARRQRAVSGDGGGRPAEEQVKEERENPRRLLADQAIARDPDTIGASELFAVLEVRADDVQEVDDANEHTLDLLGIGRRHQLLKPAVPSAELEHRWRPKGRPGSNPTPPMFEKARSARVLRRRLGADHPRGTVSRRYLRRPCPGRERTSRRCE
jgi:hypothetical protein